MEDISRAPAASNAATRWDPRRHVDIVSMRKRRRPETGVKEELASWVLSWTMRWRGLARIEDGEVTDSRTRQGNKACTLQAAKQKTTLASPGTVRRAMEEGFLVGAKLTRLFDFMLCPQWREHRDVWWFYYWRQL